MNYFNPQMGYYSPYINQQMQQQYNYSPTATSDQLQGKVVDSIDVVKAMNVDMSGNPSYYPKSDKSEIYCKQLNPQTGASYILTYKIVENSDQIGYKKENTNQIGYMIEQLSSEIAELKTIVLECLTTPSKGGE